MSRAADAWAPLEAAVRADPPLRRLFELEPDRATRLTFEACSLTLDLSKQPWSAASFANALDLARAAGLEAAREALFAGEAVNASEGRAALHMALRAPGARNWRAAGQPVAEGVAAGLERMLAFAGEVRTAGDIDAVLHIGIGGSDLGPRLVWEALAPVAPRIDLRFAANVDPSEITAALAGLDPARTLVVIVSKTFTTQETLFNARAALAWLTQAPGAADRLVAVTAAP
ncbi:MAG: glucose-6-phosphate isomerase, partial [Phenylobacterium sp.]|nr:glucose-6-phosphate isomerase [Phenylobacterium sp.]